MIRLLLASFLFLGAFSAATAQQHARARVDLTNKNLETLLQLGVETDHGDYRPGRSLTTDLSYAEIEQVRAAGFAVEILIPNVSDWYVRQNAEPVVDLRTTPPCGSGAGSSIGAYPTPENYTYGSMGGYHTYQEMLDVLDQMRTKFPNLISARAIVSDTLSTHEGRPLWYVRVSKNPDVSENEPQMLYTALHHAREPNGLSQMIFYLWYLLENYPQSAEIQYLLDHTELYFIPCINPDGYLYNESTNPQGGGMWRKNRRNSGNGVFGVDLNRNYGYQWGIDNEGSSPNANAGTYRGPAAFSEPESRMVRDFCRAHDFRLALNYHTFSNLLIYPWAYSDEPADTVFQVLGQLLTRENKYFAGTASETVGYAVNGSSDDWMLSDRNVRAMTPEVGPGTYGFWPPASAIDGLNKENVWANLSAALTLVRFGIATDLSPNELNYKQVSVPVSLRRYGLQDGPLTVSLSAISPNAEVLGTASYSFDLAYLATTQATFNVELAANTPVGAEVLLALQVSNGFYTHTDTLRKTYAGGPRVAVLTDPLTTDAAWTGDWALTTESFVSAPTSMTDSPFGNYEADALTQIQLTQGVLVPVAGAQPELRFRARWALEAGYDWVQLNLFQLGLGITQPLCGLYTHLGSLDQSPDTPLWDGSQTAWVEERIDLSEWVGQNVRLTFELHSDGVQELDGFYFDDWSITYVDTTMSSTNSPDAAVRLLTPQPNPASSEVWLGWENARFESANLLVMNTLGEIVHSETVGSAGRRLSVQNWPSGVYTCFLETANGRSAAKAFVVLHE